MKRIIIACGSGIATSTIISSRVSGLLKDNKIEHELIQCSLQEIDRYANDADLMITTMDLKKDFPVPKIAAISFLTSIGAEETEQQILDALR